MFSKTTATPEPETAQEISLQTPVSGRAELCPTLMWMIAARIPVAAAFLVLAIVFVSLLDSAKNRYNGWPGLSDPGAYYPMGPAASVEGGSWTPGKAIFAGRRGQPSALFTVGSTKADVLRAHGKPDKSEGDVWIYGSSKVHFEGDRVVKWSESPQHPLNANKAPRKSNRPVGDPRGSGKEMAIASEEVVPLRIKHAAGEEKPEPKR